MAPADDSALKYRALLEISEAFIACRDYETLLGTLWDSLHRLIRFDYLALVRYDQKAGIAWLEAIAGTSEVDAPLRTDMPVPGSPMEILLETRQPLYVPDLSFETRFRADLMEILKRYGIRTGFWVPLTRSERNFGSLSFASQSPDACGPQEREFMEHVARHVTIAVENALAFDK